METKYIPYFWKLSGWRPSFKYYNKWISLFGTILCIAVMFLMSYVTALITLVCIVLLYVFIKSRKPDVNWGSSTQSQHFITALKSVQYLTKVEDHVKNFRCSDIYEPNVTIMCRNEKLSSTMSWVGCLLTDRGLPDTCELNEWEYHTFWAGFGYFLQKRLKALNLLVNNQLNSLSNSTHHYGT